MKILSQKVQIRYSDIDMNKHVNNAVYFTLMENARTELLLDKFIEYQKKGLIFVITEASCKYKRPIMLDDSIMCDMQFEMISTLKLGVSYSFRNTETGNIHAIGRTIMVLLKDDTYKPQLIPNEMIKKLID